LSRLQTRLRLAQSRSRPSIGLPKVTTTMCAVIGVVVVVLGKPRAKPTSIITGIERRSNSMAMPRHLEEALRRRRRRPRHLLRQGPLFEHLACFDIRVLSRRKMFPGNWIERRIADSFSFLCSPIRRLTLDRGRADLLLTNGASQVVPVVWVQTHGARGCRGQRPIFVCPCKRRAVKLFYHEATFACRRCLWGRGVRYASQTRNGVTRARLQSARLRSFIRGFPDTDTTRMPEKPATWRWGRYQQLTERIARLDRKASRRRGSLLTRQITMRLLKPATEYGLILAERTSDFR
jgi:hypothetical protein